MPTYKLIFVNRTPYRVIESSVPYRDGDLLQGFSCDLYEKMADKLLPDVDIDDAAALGLRLLYGLAQETFFALLFAFLQAPEAPTAWLLRYRNRDLKELIEKYQKSQEFPSRFTCPKSGTWKELAMMLAPEPIREQEIQQTRIERLGGFWAEWALEQLDDSHRAEFNSLKHGLRAAKANPVAWIGSKQLEGEGQGSWFATFAATQQNMALGICMRSWSGKVLHSRIKLMTKSSSNILELLKLIHAPTAEKRFEYDLPIEDEMDSAKLGTKPLSTLSLSPEVAPLQSLPKLTYADAYEEYSKLTGPLRITGNLEEPQQ